MKTKAWLQAERREMQKIDLATIHKADVLG